MIKPLSLIHIALTGLALISGHVGAADTPVSLMSKYAVQAGISPQSLSAEHGAQFYRSEHPGAAGTQVSCASCHTPNPKQPGRTRVGKRIEPLAPTANPERFTDATKVEKWFRRNCMDVLKRECSAQEKGDFIAWLNQTR